LWWFSSSGLGEAFVTTTNNYDFSMAAANEAITAGLRIFRNHFFHLDAFSVHSELVDDVEQPSH